MQLLNTSTAPVRQLRNNGMRPSSVGQVVKAFNTWSFKREQPSDLQRLSSVVEAAVNRNEPIKFVLYWGKGPRSEPRLPETLCLQFLKDFGNRIRAAHPAGAQLMLILTDTHARLNQHPEPEINRYFCAMGSLAQQYGFESCRLGELVIRTCAHEAEGDGVTPEPEVLHSLTKSAMKWYGGTLSPEAAAAQYFAMNMIEKRAVAHEFPESIFITFNNSKVRSLFPDTLPIFYMYSIKKGVAIKPWFMSGVDGEDNNLNSES